MSKLLPIGALALRLSLASVPAAHAAAPGVVQPVQPAAHQVVTQAEPSVQVRAIPVDDKDQQSGKRCWYVLDVLLCD